MFLQHVVVYCVFYIVNMVAMYEANSRRRHFQTKPLFSVGQCGESAEPIGNCCKIWMGTFFCLNVKFQIALIPIERISAMKMCQIMVNVTAALKACHLYFLHIW